MVNSAGLSSCSSPALEIQGFERPTAPLAKKYLKRSSTTVHDVDQLIHNNSNNYNNINNGSYPSNNVSSMGVSVDSANESSKSKSSKSEQRSSPLRTNKRNKKFQRLFPSLATIETVIDTYSCAYVKSLNLLHGVMFLTTNYICFYSKILTAENILIIKFEHINSIRKTMHALIFPTAIRIETQNSAYTFTSFRSRSNTIEHLIKLLGNQQQMKADQSSMITDATPQNVERLNEGNEIGSSLKNNEIVEFIINDDEFEEGEENEHDLTNELLSFNDENNNNAKFNHQLLSSSSNKKHLDFDKSYAANTAYNSLYNNNANKSLKYEFDYSDLSKNKVTVSLRSNKTLLQKVKILISLLIPAFFNISRIDSLLPICFLMCVLLLLNAFVLLNKVNQVDELFADLLITTNALIS